MDSTAWLASISVTIGAASYFVLRKIGFYSAQNEETGKSEKSNPLTNSMKNHDKDSKQNNDQSNLSSIENSDLKDQQQRKMSQFQNLNASQSSNHTSQSNESNKSIEFDENSKLLEFESTSLLLGEDDLGDQFIVPKEDSLLNETEMKQTESSIKALQDPKKELIIYRDIVYHLPSVPHSNSLHEKHKLNIYVPLPEKKGCEVPIEQRKLPVVIHVHGGGWSRGDRDIGFYGAPFCGRVYSTLSRTSVASPTTHQEGVICVTPSYRLNSSAKFPAQVQDVAMAVKWTFDNISKYGGDPSQIFLSGHSAGSHLVSCLACDKSWLEQFGLTRNVIRGVVAISGIYFVSNPLSSAITEEELKQQQLCQIESSFGSFKLSVWKQIYVYPTFGTNEKQWAKASPILQLMQEENPSEIPPFLLINASFDLGLEKGAERFVSELKNKGVPVTYHVIDRTTHGSVTRSQETIEKSLRWICEELWKEKQ